MVSLPPFPNGPRFPNGVPLPEPPEGTRGAPSGTPEDRIARWQAWQERTHGSFLEFICWEWLTFKKRLKEGLDFFQQFAIQGGRTFIGGYVIDFYFPDRRLAWLVQGLYFHTTRPEQRARDALARETIAAEGITAVEIFEDDLLQREQYTLEQAYNGNQLRRRV